MAGSCFLRDCGDPTCRVCATGRLPQPVKLAPKLRDGLKANAKATKGKSTSKRR